MDSINEHEDKSLLLTPLSTNQDLRYSKYYDLVKEARRHVEEDNKLADYESVREICLDVLSTKTKDLHFLSFYLEACLHLGKLHSLAQDLSVAREFILAFFDTMFPLNTQESEPFEAKLTVLTWIKGMYIKTLPLMPLPGTTMSLADWRFIRYHDPHARYNGLIDKSFLLPAHTALKNLCETLDQLMPHHYLNFAEIGDIFLEIEKIPCKDPPQNPENDTPAMGYNEHLLQKNANNTRTSQQAHSPDSSSEQALDQRHVEEIDSRKAAYKALRDLAEFLQMIEPHSMTPPILRMISKWEGKTFPQVISSIANESHDVQILLSILANVKDTMPHPHHDTPEKEIKPHGFSTQELKANG